MAEKDKGGNSKDQKWLAKFDQDLRDNKFYGKVTLSYQNGKIIHYEKRVTGRPE